mmetsp:Transcript_16291/g.40131  ORF Transcript_16291/g.40131 Transcript_16291/m.40131 type:complete len:277 (-) Transcript_16291:1977-2807(-)
MKDVTSVLLPLVEDFQHLLTIRGTSKKVASGFQSSRNIRKEILQHVPIPEEIVGSEHACHGVILVVQSRNGPAPDVVRLLEIDLHSAELVFGLAVPPPGGIDLGRREVDASDVRDPSGLPFVKIPATATGEVEKAEASPAAAETHDQPPLHLIVEPLQRRRDALRTFPHRLDLTPMMVVVCLCLLDVSFQFHPLARLPLSRSSSEPGGAIIPHVRLPPRECQGGRRCADRQRLPLRGDAEVRPPRRPLGQLGGSQLRHPNPPLALAFAFDAAREAH